MDDKTLKHKHIVEITCPENSQAMKHEMEI